MDTGVIDLFCGAGGLTRGLEIEGLDVRAGFDVDPACHYPYEANNWATFVEKDIAKVTVRTLSQYWEGCAVRVLAGCAPCQPFSTYTQARSDEIDKRWRLLIAFGRLVVSCQPELVTMENVAELARHHVYSKFVKKLKTAGYHVSENIVDCEQYGIPQNRRRLVLLASRFGPIELLSPRAFGAPSKTVRDAIGNLLLFRMGQPIGATRSTKAVLFRAQICAA
jgi:DNA (cytosine-5)-methyltransferase 1